MGAVKIDLATKEKRLEDIYPIDEPIGVYVLLSNIHYVMEARFLRGDYNACNMLIDFMDSIENCNLTERQRQVLDLVFMQDLRQQDVAEMIDVSQQAVSDHISNAVKKIAFYNRLGAN